MKRLALVSVAIFTICFTAIAQFPNTNSWIKEGQPYFRLPVIDDGIHRVEKADLKNLGVPTETIANDFYRVYEHGKEIPLNVTSEYIEFYAERAKGDLDTLLYEKKSDQLGTSYSQYTDTAYYYLTYGTTKGLRFTAQNNTNTTGLNKVESYNKTVFHYYNTNYEFGERIYPSLQHPGYGAGDCWVSQRINRNSVITEKVNLSDFYTGGSGFFKTAVVGANNRTADAAKHDGYNNQIVAEINNGSWVEKTRKLYNGFTRHDIEFDFDKDDISNDFFEFKLSHDRDYNGVKNAFNGQSNISEVEINYDAIPKLIDGKYGFMNLNSSNQDLALVVENVTASSYVIYDLKNKTSFVQKIEDGKLHIRLSSSNLGYSIVISANEVTRDIKPRKINIEKIELFSETDFLIVTNKIFQSAAEEYANYKSSTQGGNFNVNVVYVDDIYKEYYFGYHHPLAVKLLLKAVLNKSPNLKHVLFLGKAVNPSFIKKNGIFDYKLDLVPSIGSPCSDWYYGYKIHDNKIVAPFSIGRISATSNSDIKNYLDKLKAHNKLNNEKWRKDVIHVSGGKSGSELIRFANYMDALGEIIESPNVGANVSYYGKEKGLVVDEDLKKGIIQQINNGAGFFSYFGHAALNVTEVDIGTPIEYNNGNYPLVMYFAGCVLGGCYEENGSLGEDFIDAETGAITWIAASTFSFESTVFDFTNSWYTELSGPKYGETVGEVSRSTIEKFIGEGGNLFSESQAYQMIIQGDPSVKMYSPENSDYEITGNDVFITPEGVTAQADSFFVNAEIRNLGKAIEEDLKIFYEIKFPNGAKQTDTVWVKNLYNTNTFTFTVFNTNNTFGKHSIEIRLDPDNEILELNENNNRSVKDFYLYSNGSVGLFPPSFGIVSSRDIELVGQSLDLNSKNNIFQFEVDTTPSFKSNWRKQSGDLKGNLIGRWKVNLLENDSQDYYWRLRLKTPEGNYTPWSSRSFSFIENSLEGWAQVDFEQLLTSETFDMYADTTDESFHFYRFTAPGQFIVKNHGRDFPQYEWYRFGRPPVHWRDERFFRDNNYSMIDGALSLNGMCVYAFEPNLNEENTFNSWSLDMGKKVYERNGEMRFDWMKTETEIDAEILDSFISFLNQVPNGYNILMYSGWYHRIDDMPNRFYEAIEQFGSAKIRKVNNNGVWILVGTKGLAPGKAHDEQYTTKQDTLLESSTTFTVVKSKGKLVSQQIGPSKKWRKLTLNSMGVAQPNDFIDNSYNIIAIDTTGEKIILLDNFRKNSLDLSFIDANRYPYLQIELNTENKKNYKPAKPLSWIVNYDYLPEGIINTEVAYKFNSDTLQKGEELKFEIGYQNVSNLSLEPIPIQYEIIDKNRNVKISEKDTLRALAPGESSTIKGTFPSSGLINENRLIIKTNPNGSIPELYSFNNNFEKSFFVEGDKERPTLEVTFDGIRIIDGDIISPKPSIVITGTDNNSFFLLDKPEHFEVYLEKHDSGVVKIDQMSSGFTFYPATKGNQKARIEYNPNWLNDGEYTLSVQLEDGSGNTSGVTAYEVNFEVVGKSTVTNFYPYPNPFSTQMRFVFTLTGDREPDDIIIQIMTVTGKVVKEIHKSELGALKIGQNTSSFAWDGTDMYGNKLANGLYLYRVKTVIDGKQVELRNTSSDISFKEGFGKIYILR